MGSTLHRMIQEQDERWRERGWCPICLLTVDNTVWPRALRTHLADDHPLIADALGITRPD